MRTLLLLLATALAQPAPQTHLSHTTESLRGVSAVSKNIAWASGTHGTYLRTTDAGRTWLPAQVPDAATLDFRAVVAFSATEAFLMSAGPGDQSRIYHTSDAGRHWQLQFTNTNPKGFFDSMVFWDPTHGIVLGDPIPDQSSDESGKETAQLKFELLITTDGETWTHLPPAQLPPAIEGEGAFAASNTCLAILPSTPTRTPTPTPLQNLVIPTGAGASATAQWRNLLFAGATTPSAPATPPEQSQKPATSAPRKLAQKAPDPNIWFATGGQRSPSLPLSRPRPDLASLRHSNRSRPRLRRNLLHSFPRPHSRSNRRRRLQTSRSGRPQPRLHQRRRQNLDSLPIPPPSLLLRRRL